MFIRDFIHGEQEILREVFISSVHELACDYYTKEQLDAWASPTYDQQQWTEKIAALRPFVAVIDDRVAGYADLQCSGLIDHFFVSGRFSGRGVGSALMTHIHQAAAARRIQELSAHVSLAAEAFFSRHGFLVMERQSVVVRGVALDNSLMAKHVVADSSFEPTPLRSAN